MSSRSKHYPLFAHLAQTGQILKSKNRPGNVHDSKGADAFLRELIGELRGQFGRSRKLEFRTDAAFFKRKDSQEARAPIPAPAAIRSMPLETVQPRTSEAFAPRAIRTPISLVRWRTV